jgi:hypothetical protein
MDYGCVVYQTASKTQLNKLDCVQSLALRLCLGALRQSPSEAVRVIAGEKPLQLRRIQLSIGFYKKIKDRFPTDPTGAFLPCWQYNLWEHKNGPFVIGDGPPRLSSSGFLILQCYQHLVDSDSQFNAKVLRKLPLSVLEPVRIVNSPLTNSRRVSDHVAKKNLVNQYIYQEWEYHLKVFTDAAINKH